MAKQRNSSFELIRIICILYVVYWHSISPYLNDTASFNLIPITVINSMCNTTNLLFMLLSGYFGIRLSLEKLIKLDIAIIFYDVAYVLLTGNLGIKSIVTAFMPITFKSHWFLSCYFAIALLSGFLNKIPEKLDRRAFRNLLLLLVGIFYLLPTIFITELVEDSGKGVICMSIVYLLGRYIRLYYSEIQLRKAPLFGIFAGCILLTAALDTVLSLLKDTFMGLYCRDNSIFILIASTAFFLLFREIHFTNRLVNKLAPNVVMLYCIEGYARAISGNYFSLDAYKNSPLFLVVVLIYALVLIALCMLLNELRLLILEKADSWLAKRLLAIGTSLAKRITSLADRLQQAACSVLIKK